jgi:hypothetical protein
MAKSYRSMVKRWFTVSRRGCYDTARSKRRGRLLPQRPLIGVSSPGGRGCGFCPAPRVRKFPRVPPRVSASARIDRQECPHRKAPGPSRRSLAARRVCQRSVRGRCSPGSGIWCLIYQTLNQSKKTATHVHRRSASRSHPQRPEERCARQFLLARPDEIHALGCGSGGWIEPTRVSRRSAHTRELLWFAML